MKFEKSKTYNKDFLKENMMGPNCMKMLEDMAGHMRLEPGMRVLDLGCGRGLTSIFLAKEYGVTVFATDLWIAATENYLRFKEMGLEDKIIPIHANALDLPYAEEYFDAAVSVDAYHYFGAEDTQYMDRCLAPLVRPGGTIAIAVPGTRKDHESVPKEMVPYISEEDFATFRSLRWWKECVDGNRLFKTERIYEFEDFDEIWNDWLECDNPYAINDRGMIKDSGHVMNLVAMIGKRV